MRKFKTVAVIYFLIVASAAADERLQPINADKFADILTAERGNVVLVNFWATWCRPCLKEIPELMALEEELRDQGFVLVPVSLDDAGSLESMVIPFMQKWFPDFESYASLESLMDSIVSVVDPAWNEILPTSYVLNRAGQRAVTIQGGKSGEEFAAAIEPLLENDR